MIFRWKGDNGAGSLGHSVHLHEAAAEDLDALAQQSEWYRARSVRNVFEVHVVDLTRSRMVHDRLQRGWYKEHLIDLLTVDQLQNAIWIKIPQNNALGSAG